jgi:hypothetical protein
MAVIFVFIYFYNFDKEGLGSLMFIYCTLMLDGCPEYSTSFPLLFQASVCILRFLDLQSFPFRYLRRLRIGYLR